MAELAFRIAPRPQRRRNVPLDVRLVASQKDARPMWPDGKPSNTGGNDQNFAHPAMNLFTGHFEKTFTINSDPNLKSPAAFGFHSVMQKNLLGCEIRAGRKA